MHKKIIFLLSVIFIFSENIFAQNKSNKTAFGCEKGIYIQNLIHAANKNSPYNRGTKYIVERALASDSRFVKLFTYQSPTDIKTFYNELEKQKNRMLFPVDLSGINLLNVWKHYQKNLPWDSLSTELSSQPLAAGLGVLIFDSTANKNVKYIYKISLVDDADKVIESITTNEVNFPEKMNYLKPTFASKSTDGKIISLTWKTSTDRKPHHFKVYRADNEMTIYKELAVSFSISQKRDSNFFYFSDENVSNEKTYRYIISPSNIYGNYNVFSDTISATAKLIKEIDLPESLAASGIDSLNAIKLTWKLKNKNAISAIKIFRSTDYENNFSEIKSLNANENFYTDKSAAPGQKYYYYIKVVDRFANLSLATNKVFALYSGNRIPFAPLKVFVKATEQGVRINWFANGDFLRGFYIYRCEGIDGNMQQISSFIPYRNNEMYEWMDKSSDMKFGVTYGYTVSQESNGHIAGPFAKTDYTIPAHIKMNNHFPAVNLNVNAVNNFAILTWENKFSEQGISGINILRKKADEKIFQQINRRLILSTAVAFTDSTAESGEKYDYQLSFVSSQNTEAGKSSVAHFETVALQLSSPQNLRASVENNSVKLFWKYNGKNTSGFKVYRKVPGTKPELIATIKSMELSYTDSKTYKEKISIYYITAFDKNGKESEPSNDCKVGY